jgi:hypothetical protein
MRTKEEVLDKFEETRTEFLRQCRIIAYEVFRNNGRVTIDDVRGRVEIPNEVDGRVFGAVFNSKEWQRIGYESTKVKSSHRRPIGVFVLK